MQKCNQYIGLEFLGTVNHAVPFHLFRAYVLSIRNSVAYAYEANIVNKDSPILQVAECTNTRNRPIKACEYLRWREDMNCMFEWQEQ